MHGWRDKGSIFVARNARLYDELLDPNSEIYEYNGCIHSKAIMINDDVTILGSNNLDMRWLFINFETAIIVKSNNINSQISNKQKKLMLE